MRRTYFLRGCAAGFALAAGATAAHASGMPPPSVTIYHVPDALLSDTAIAPDRLPTMRNVTKRIAYGSDVVEGVQAAVRAAVPVSLGSKAHSLDARWSLIIAGAGGVSHVACDATGLQGLVDGRRVRFANRAVVEAFARLIRTGHVA